MNTKKVIYEKLFKADKTKLAKHEVNLALLQDLQTYVKGTRTVTANYAKYKALIEKNVAAMKQAVESLRVNKDYGKKTLASAQKFKAQFDKLSKELGVNLTGSEADKLISELFMLAEDTDGIIEDALASLNALK